MYKLSVTDSFSAAHRLCGYEGACKNLHGHNWGVRVCIIASELDEIGMAVDFGVIKKLLTGILAPLDHAYLNDVEELDGVNPTSENLAKYVYERMQKELEGQPASVSFVDICESERSSVVYSND
ncbi:MAG: 6-carboxytetrahydropterin synthase QueD [Candidatus Cloacimonadaceae bacterium]|nr:6-carboxytetrahydropterin synthase QueD [Candidatus Cloacimonadaceae bacterium]MDP3113338.1 6-carboxytetrahydropterin synthase QueD [Candidatus Cloacimonadaceae bacterium]